MKRGGKPILTDRQRFQVGAECESLLQKLATAQALARLDEKPYIQEVRRAQGKVRSARWQYEKQRQSEAIDEVFERLHRAQHRTPKFTRASEVKKSRPYGRTDQVLGRATLWCWQRYR